MPLINLWLPCAHARFDSALLSDGSLATVRLAKSAPSAVVGDSFAACILRPFDDGHPLAREPSVCVRYKLLNALLRPPRRGW